MAQFIGKCPHCGTQFTMLSEWIGQNVQCTSCGNVFSVRQTAKPPAAPRAAGQGSSSSGLKTALLIAAAGTFLVLITAVLILLIARPSSNGETARSQAAGKSELLRKYSDHVPEEDLLVYIGERPSRTGNEIANTLLNLEKADLLEEFQEDVDAYHRAR